MAERDYLVTARKYRPSLFKEVVAQEHVTDTLKNAIKLDRLAHAYLFSGPRGIGKTTAARILAKAINCETPREEREDGAEPCCECDSCTSFEDGRSLNVFEMDAASNNKVDDIRELREKVRIPPQGEQKKVYILDEVHMLSNQAFNALLKTLEEPPAHALFIFATTEPHKVLPTILSRCQRFDFRRIPVPRIVARLREICETEGVEAEEESLMLLARKGNGALRDALSAFDQAISLCGDTLEYSELAQAMGVVDQDLYFDLTDHVATQNTAGVLELVRHVVRSGYDLQEFLVGLAEHLRNLLVVHSLGGEALEGVAEATRTQYADEADRFEEADLLRLLTVAGEAEDEVKNSPQPRLKLETTLLKMAQMRRATDLRAVIRKIDKLEQMVEEGTLPASLDEMGTADAAPATDAGTTEAPADTGASEPTPSYETPGEDSEAEPPASESEAEAQETEAPSASGGGQADKSATDKSATDKSATDKSATEESASDDSEPFTPPDHVGTPDETASEPTDDADDSANPGSSEREDESEPDPPSAPSREDEDATVEYNDLFGTPALDDSGSGGDGASGGNGSTDASGETGDEDDPAGSGPQAAVAEPPVAAGAATVEALEDRWLELVQDVKSDRISLGSLLGETEPVSLSGGELTVEVPKALHRDSLRDDKRFVLERLTGLFDVSVDEIRFVVDESASTDDASADSDDPLSPREQLQQLRDTYPALDVLFNDFGAEPVW
jgi:DNA polymerase-3 subunit gamma/tau